MKKTDNKGTLDLLSLEYLVDSNASYWGRPVPGGLSSLSRLQGVDLLLCLVNPYSSARVGHADDRGGGYEVIPHFSLLTFPLLGRLEVRKKHYHLPLPRHQP